MINLTEENLTINERKWLSDYIKRTAKALGISENSQDPRLIKLKKQLLNKISSNRSKTLNESEKVRKKVLSESIQKANNDGVITTEERNGAIAESNRKANNVKKRNYLS